MIRRGIISIALLLCTSVNAESVAWFERNTPLTQAHKHLLNDDLSAMFTSLVEVWQQDKNTAIKPHLNALLLQSLESDCGKSLDQNPLPSWINSIVVRRMALESPGRDAYRAVIEAKATKGVRDITLTRWVSKSISTDDQFVKEQGAEGSEEITYTKRYNLNGRIPMGLYRLDVTAEDQSSWSSWVILGDPKAEVTIRWAEKDQWAVDKNALLNPNCPQPRLETSIYDYIDDMYVEVWSEGYQSSYPTKLQSSTPVAPGRYVLAISMQHQRWQGPIIVEQSQIISKTYDVSVEE